MTSPNLSAAGLVEGPTEAGLWASFTCFGWLWAHSWNPSWVGQMEGI